MSIQANEAICLARERLGTPYGELDCINLVKWIIRSAPGGKPGYTTATTVSLWESAGMSPKYRDLTWRQTSIKGAKAGMLAFKQYEKAADHVGLVTGEGTVIHSSSEHGQVVETPLTEREGWNLLAIHRYIDVETDEEERATLYLARVVTKDTALNLRDAPAGNRIGSIPRGETVDVLSEAGAWMQVRANEMSGYVSAAYLEKVEDLSADTTTSCGSNDERPVVIDDAGNVFVPQGGFRVEIRLVKD